MNNGQLTIMVSLRDDLKFIPEGDTAIVNFQLSIVNSRSMRGKP